MHDTSPNHKKLFIVGMSCYYAVKTALEVRLLYLQSFKTQCERRGQQAAVGQLTEEISQLTFCLDELNEAPWE